MLKFKNKCVHFLIVILLSVGLMCASHAHAASDSIIGGIAGGAAAGAAIGSVFTPVGAATGAAVGAVTIGTWRTIKKIIKWRTAENGTFPKILEDFQSINEGCWFCPIFNKLFEAINKLATSLKDTLTDYGLYLLGLGFLFYILFKVLKVVISFGETNPKEFFTDLLMPILKCVIAGAVLANLGSFYKHVVNPLLLLSIGFATEISSAGAEAGLDSFVQIKEIDGVASAHEVCPALTVSSISDGAVFDESVNNAFQCFLKTVSSSVLLYMALGATFIADSFQLGGWQKVLPLFSMFLVGLCLFCGSFGVFLSFPFKLLDAMFRLMFVAALMPLWVILWVLPATRDKSKAAFSMFLNVLITFICLSVVLLMVLVVLSVALGDLTDMWPLLIQGRTKEALELIDWSKGTFFSMLAMTFLAFSLSQKSDSFVKEFGGGGSLGMGEGLQGMAMAGASAVGSKLGKPVLQKGVGTLKDGAVKVGGAVKDKAKKIPYAVGFLRGRYKSEKPFFEGAGTGIMSGLKSGGKSLYDASILNPIGKGIKQIKKDLVQGYKDGLSGPDSSGSTTPPPGGGGGGTPPPGGGGTPPPGGGGGSGGQNPHTAEAAAKKAEEAAKKAEQAAEKAKKAEEATKQEVERLGATAPNALEALLKNPSQLGAIISAVSGGIVPANLVSAGVLALTSTMKDNLPDGKIKETTVETYKKDGQSVRQSTESVIRDEVGRLLSTISRHELINPETQEKVAIEIERDASGKLVSFIKELKDQAGNMLSQVKMDAKGNVINRS